MGMKGLQVLTAVPSLIFSHVILCT